MTSQSLRLGVRTLDILLVEDQPHDVELIELALKRAEVQYVLHVISDGDDALNSVDGLGVSRNTFRPDLMILDLSLPGASGFEVLARVKADEELRTIPVIVLTSSGAEMDVWRSYHSHANAYMMKPVGLEDFLVAFGHLVKFFLQTAYLPPRRRVDGDELKHDHQL